MRQNGKNNRHRGRSRRGGGGQINRNTTLDSNGPDVRLRGNAFQLYEKYVSLGNDASAAGERISAEAYYQHADHYFRVHSAVTSASEERRGQNSNGKAQAATQTQAQAQDQAEVTPTGQAGAEASVDAKETGAEAAASKDAAADSTTTEVTEDAEGNTAAQ